MKSRRELEAELNNLKLLEESEKENKELQLRKEKVEELVRSYQLILEDNLDVENTKRFVELSGKTPEEVEALHRIADVAYDLGYNTDFSTYSSLYAVFDEKGKQTKEKGSAVILKVSW
jgi:hypothetical protein